MQPPACDLLWISYILGSACTCADCEPVSFEQERGLGAMTSLPALHAQQKLNLWLQAQCQVEHMTGIVPAHAWKSARVGYHGAAIPSTAASEGTETPCRPWPRMTLSPVPGAGDAARPARAGAAGGAGARPDARLGPPARAARAEQGVRHSCITGSMQNIPSSEQLLQASWFT